MPPTLFSSLLLTHRLVIFEALPEQGGGTCVVRKAHCKVCGMTPRRGGNMIKAVPPGGRALGRGSHPRLPPNPLQPRVPRRAPQAPPAGCVPVRVPEPEGSALGAPRAPAPFTPGGAPLGRASMPSARAGQLSGPASADGPAGLGSAGKAALLAFDPRPPSSSDPPPLPQPRGCGNSRIFSNKAAFIRSSEKGRPLSLITTQGESQRFETQATAVAS